MSIKKQAGSKKFVTLVTVTAVTIFFLAWNIFLNAIYVPVILMYHSVGEKGVALDGYEEKLNVSPAAFAKQMKFLHNHNYRVIPLAEFIEGIKALRKIPPRTIAITFDDGLKNNFLNAYPVLKKYNFPATIFIPTDFIGKKGFLDLEHIKTMQENNIFIGSHTVSHRWLPALDEEGLRSELYGSKKILEGITGREIKTLAYPLGAYDEKVKKIAMEAGYLGAVATNPGRSKPKDDIFALKRIRISMTSDNPLIFWIETSGYYTFIKEIRDAD